MLNPIPLDVLYDLLLQWGYVLFFPIMVIEGPIVTVLGGFLVSLGYFNFWLVYILCILGDLVGDTLYYAFGRWGGRKFVLRWGKYLRLNLKYIEHLETHFHKHGGKTLFLGKVAQVVGAAFLIAAGMAKMKYSRFMLVNLGLTIIKSFILLLVGYYFGRSYKNINSYLDIASLLTLVVGLLIFFFLRKKIVALFSKHLATDV